MVINNKETQHIETERLNCKRFERVITSDMFKYKLLFSEYKHNIPVIHSLLEGQYKGKLYVDDTTDPKVAVLFTPFDFHYVAGDINAENIVDVLDDMIFCEYLLSNKSKEAIFFSPNSKWDAILDDVFNRHRGIKDSRYIFCLDKSKYHDNRNKYKPMDDIKSEIVYVKDRGALKEYPESRIYKDDICISYCAGFMLGNGHAEIDIFTEENYRNKGYAKEVAFGLIDELLKNNIEPDWCTWPYRKASQELATSLGYELIEEVTAHIWVEEECGPIV